MGVKKILYIAWEFPPVNTTGAFRSFRFVQQLCTDPELEVSVLTLERNNGSELFKRPIDKSFRDGELKLAHRLEVRSAPPPVSRFKLLNYLRNHFLIITDTLTDRVLPEDRKRIFRFVAETRPDIIIASAPPFSVLKLCLALNKKFGIPYILDMRDLFTLWGGVTWASKWHYRQANKIEQKAYAAAKAIVSVTPQVIDILRKGFPAVDAAKFHFIPNAFSTTAQTVSAAGLNQGGEVHLAYVGGYYYDETVGRVKRKGLARWLNYQTHPNELWIYRSPYFFLKTLGAFLQKNPQYRNRVHFHYYGDSPAYQERFVREFGLQNNFTAHGFLPRTTLAGELANMNFFISTAEKVTNGEHYCLPSKLAEYLQYEKPVIGFVTPGIQKEFIAQGGIGVCIDPDNDTTALQQFTEVLEQGFEATVNTRYLASFTIQYCTQQLKELIDK
ncbi:MAG: glycosyltransferase [Dinghuibacter sp.]|nr:glycosyltransferase [Dinghuibacter sp.]